MTSSPRQRRWRSRIAGVVVSCVPLMLAVLANGCASPIRPVPPPTAMPEIELEAGLMPARFIAELGAFAVPPIGWTLDPVKSTRTFYHLTWVSPSRHTAYGIIYFRLPLPVGHEIALRLGVIPEMVRRHGQATLLDKYWDPATGGLRFVIEGGPYRVRSTMHVRGLSGWTIYAGTLREHPEEPAELHLAERARETTRVGG